MTRALLLVALVLGCAGPLAAQDNDRPQNRVELERRVRQVFLNRLRQELRLTPDEITALQEVIRWSEAQRQAVAAETRAMNERVTEYLRSGGPEQAARELLEERVEIQTREARLFAEEQERLLAVMSAPQVVRFYVIRDDLNDRIRRLRGNLQQRRRGGS